jgi:hypothetical protein
VATDRAYSGEKPSPFRRKVALPPGPPAGRRTGLEAFWTP